MRFEEWEPIYTAICEEFGYDRSADEQAADVMREFVSPGVTDRLALEDAAVAVVVGADLDWEAIREVKDADQVVATADALRRLHTASVNVSLVVTDLDSNPPLVCSRTRSGGLVALHAHGDNQPVIQEWVPRMRQSNLIGTSQAKPEAPLVNMGGFTDGDRAAYLADGLDAASISLVGWDLADETVSATKRAKLEWAAKLLTALERRRGERYAALDGHRSPLPTF